MAVSLSVIRDMLLPGLRRVLSLRSYPPYTAMFNDKTYSIRKAVEIATVVAAGDVGYRVSHFTRASDPPTVITRSIFEHLEGIVEREVVR